MIRNTMSNTELHSTTIRPSRALKRHFMSLGREVVRWSDQKTLQTVSIGVTRLSDDDGSSTVAFNLAAGLTTLLGRGVLFVESDFGNSYLSRRSDAGLSEVLLENAEVKDVVKGFQNNENLYAISCGRVKEKESIDLPVQNLGSIIQDEMDEFDFVVFDLPVADGLSTCDAIASHLDGIVLVVDEKLIVPKKVAAFRSRMQRLGIEIIGLVVNKARV